MTRKNDAVPALRHHKASGQAYVNLSGHRLYLGKVGTPEAQTKYDRTIAEWLASGRARTVDASGLLVVELIDRYWQHCTEYYRDPSGGPADSLARLRRPLRDLRTLYGDTPAAEFGPLALRALRESWIDAGLTRKTINDYAQVIKALFKWSVSHELTGAEVHTALTTVESLRAGRTRAKEGRKVAPVPMDVVDKTIANLPSPVAALVRLQLLTGARSGELLNLTPRDIDRSDPDVWIARLDRHKTAHRGKERTLYFGPQAQEVLRPFLLREADRPLFSPRDAVRERCEARRTGPGRRPDQKPNPRKTRRIVRDSYDRQSYNKAISRACEKAGVPNWWPHQLRHNRATELRKALGIEAAQVALGHAHADVTQIYAERDAAKARQIALERG